MPLPASWRIDESEKSCPESQSPFNAARDCGSYAVIAGSIDHAASCFDTVGLAMGPWGSFRSDQLWGTKRGQPPINLVVVAFGLHASFGEQGGYRNSNSAGVIQVTSR
jgi:hypothetical protein